MPVTVGLPVPEALGLTVGLPVPDGLLDLAGGATRDGGATCDVNGPLVN